MGRLNFELGGSDILAYLRRYLRIYLQIGRARLVLLSCLLSPCGPLSISETQGLTVRPDVHELAPPIRSSSEQTYLIAYYTGASCGDIHMGTHDGK